MNKSKKGVTLIELVAVIAISAILLIIAIPVVGGILDNAKLSTLKETTATVKTSCLLEDDGCESETKFSELNYVDFPSEYDLEKSTVQAGGAVVITEDNTENTYVFNIYFKDETFPVVYYRTEDDILNAKDLDELAMTDDQKAHSFDFKGFVMDVVEQCYGNSHIESCQGGYKVSDLEYLSKNTTIYSSDFEVPDVIDGTKSYIEMRSYKYYLTVYYKNDSSFGETDSRPMIAFYSLDEIMNADNYEDLRE